MYIFEINLKNSPSAPHLPDRVTTKRGESVLRVCSGAVSGGKEGMGEEKGRGRVFFLSVGHRRENPGVLKVAEMEQLQGHLEKSSVSW